MKLSVVSLAYLLLSQSVTAEHLRRPVEDDPELRALSGGCSSGLAESQTIAITNSERTSRGLRALSCDARVQRLAYDYSKTMCNRRCFGHHCNGGVDDRLERAGVQWRSYGENVAVGYRTPPEVMEGWMDSSGHRDNILGSSFREIGIGIYNCGGRLYWTMVLVTQRNSAPAPAPAPAPYLPPKKDPVSFDPPDYSYSCGSAIESKAVELVNERRIKRKRTPVGCNTRASRVARDFSRQMCREGCVGSGCDLDDIDVGLERAGIQGVYVYSWYVASGYSSAEEIVDKWRWKVLSRYISEIGVGAYDCDGYLYWTMVLFDEYGDF